MSDEKIRGAGWTKVGEATEKKRPSIFSRCHPRVVGEGADRHIEVDCKSKEDSLEYAELLEKEVVIRVKPTMVIEETEDAGKVEKDGA